MITRVELRDYLELLFDKYCSNIAVHGFGRWNF